MHKCTMHIMQQWSHDVILSRHLGPLHQAGEDTFLQLEFWDESQDLIRRSAALIRKAGLQHRVILGSPGNSNIWKMCGEELPEAPRILPMSEVCHDKCLNFNFRLGSSVLAVVGRAADQGGPKACRHFKV